MFPGAAARPLLAASSTGHRLSVIASSYQGTQRPTRSCPSRRPGREQRVLCEAGRRRGSEDSPAEALLPPKPLLGLGARCPAVEAHKCCWFLKVLQLRLSSALLDPPVQWACSNLAPIRQLSLTAAHSSPPTEWANLGSSSTCTNHSAFLLCVGLSGVAACVFRDFSIALPSPILRVQRTGQNNLLLHLRLRLLPKPPSNSYCRGRREGGLGVMPPCLTRTPCKSRSSILCSILDYMKSPLRA